MERRGNPVHTIPESIMIRTVSFRNYHIRDQSELDALDTVLSRFYATCQLNKNTESCSLRVGILAQESESQSDKLLSIEGHGQRFRYCPNRSHGQVGLSLFRV